MKYQVFQQSSLAAMTILRKMPNNKLSESQSISISIYIIESVRLFVCLFTVNAKTTARIDAKRSGITKNDPESVLCVLKSPVLVFLGRYRDISGFSFAADHHFYFSHFHFRLLRRRLTQSAFVKTRRPCATSVLFHR